MITWQQALKVARDQVWNLSPLGPVLKPLAKLTAQPVRLLPEPLAERVESAAVENLVDVLEWEGDLGAAFRQENDVVNALLAFSLNNIRADPDFDVERAIKGDPIAIRYPDVFEDSLSQKEFDARKLWLLQQRKDRQALATSGISGLGAALAAGLASPTILLPGGAIVRGVKAASVAKSALPAARSAAGWSAVAVGAQEAVLGSSQDLRTWGETAANVSTGAVIGGILGGAVQATVSKNLLKKWANASPKEFLEKKKWLGLGKDGFVVERDLPEILGKEHALFKQLSGPQRVFASNVSPTQSAMAAKMTTLGLLGKKDGEIVPLFAGGDVESRLPNYEGIYHVEVAKPARALAQKVTGSGLLPPSARSTLQLPATNKFYEDVGTVLHTGKQSDVPEVNEAARLYGEFFDETFLGRVREYEKEVGQEFAPLADIKDRQSFLRGFTRMFNSKKVADDYEGLRDLLVEFFEEKLLTDWQKRYQRVAGKVEEAQTKADVIGLADADAEALVARMEADRATLRAEQPRDVEEAIETLEELTSAARTSSPNMRKALWGEVRKFKDENAGLLQPYNAKLKVIGGTEKLLERTAFGLRRRRTVALERLEKLNELQDTSLNAFAGRAHRLLARMDRFTDKQLAEELDKLQEDRRKLVELVDRSGGQATVLDDLGEEVSLDDIARRVEELYDERVALEDQLENVASGGKWAKLDKKVKLLKRREDELEEFYGQVYAEQQGDTEAVAKIASKLANKVILDDPSPATPRDAKYLAKRRKRFAEKTGRYVELLQEGHGPLAEKVRGDLREVQERARVTLDRRAVRMGELRKELKSLTPEVAESEADKFARKARALRKDFASKKSIALKEKRKFVAEGGDPVFDVAEAATEAAESVLASAAKLNKPLVQSAPSQVSRKTFSELLTLDPERVWGNGRTLNQFIERDVSAIALRLIRGLAPDMELFRKFGTPDPMHITSPLYKDMYEDLNRALEAAPEGEKARLIDQFKANKRDLKVMVERIRNVYGMPDDPDSFAYQFFEFAKNWNMLRLGGQISLASMVDIGRPVMNFGLQRTFRESFRLFTNGIRHINMSVEDAQYAGVATELTNAVRLQQLFDIQEDYHSRNKLFGATRKLSNAFGLIAWFSVWTNMMKAWTGALSVSSLARDFPIVLGEKKATKRQMRQAVRLVAKAGFSKENVEQMWRAMSDGGFVTLKDTGFGKPILPNAQVWEDKEAAAMFHAGIVRLTNDTIVTPGLEIPNFVDANQMSRIVMQMRRFSLSSTTKVVQAGLQDARAQPTAFLAGVMGHLMLGAMVYALKSYATGGARQKTMEEADEALWVDEAINHSGLLGILGEARSLAERTPGLDDFVTFSERRTAKAAFSRPLYQTFGTAESMLFGAQRVMVTAGNPTGETAGQFRRLIPGQNLFYLSQAFTAVEEAARPRKPRKLKKRGGNRL